MLRYLVCATLALAVTANSSSAQAQSVHVEKTSPTLTDFEISGPRNGLDPITLEEADRYFRQHVLQESEGVSVIVSYSLQPSQGAFINGVFKSGLYTGKFFVSLTSSSECSRPKPLSSGVQFTPQNARCLTLASKGSVDQLNVRFENQSQNFAERLTLATAQMDSLSRRVAALEARGPNEVSLDQLKAVITQLETLKSEVKQMRSQ